MTDRERRAALDDLAKKAIAEGDYDIVYAGDRGVSALVSRNAIIDRAVEVLGNAEKALRWLHTPVPSLGDTPIRLLRTAEGAAKVENALGAIEDGAW